jgi:hypothetical protein
MQIFTFGCELKTFCAETTSHARSTVREEIQFEMKAHQLNGALR